MCGALSRSRVHKCLSELRLESGLSTRMGHRGRARLVSIWAGFLGHDPRHRSAVPGREPVPCAQGPQAYQTLSERLLRAPVALNRAPGYDCFFLKKKNPWGASDWIEMLGCKIERSVQGHNFEGPRDRHSESHVEWCGWPPPVLRDQRNL